MTRMKKSLFIFLKLCVSAGLLFFIISKTGIDKIGATLKAMEVEAFIAACAIYVFSLYISSMRWKLLLHGENTTGRLFTLYLIGAFFNNILPGIIGGDAVKAYYLYRDTGKSAPAIASVFMDRYVGFAAMMFIGASAYPLGFAYFRGSYIEWTLPLIILCFILGSAIVFGLQVGRRFAFVGSLYEYFGLYRGRRDIILKAFLISLVVQGLNIFAVYILSVGLHVNVPLLPLFVFLPIISTMATIPISISGLGVREASFVLLLGFLDISPVSATAVSFSWFLSVAAGSLPGLYEYLRYKKTASAPVAPHSS